MSEKHDANLTKTVSSAVLDDDKDSVNHPLNFLEIANDEIDFIYSRMFDELTLIFKNDNKLDRYNEK